MTREQVQRLCGVERVMCGVVLKALVEAKFLTANPDGTYGRFTDEDMLRRRAVKAELGIGQRVKAS